MKKIVNVYLDEGKLEELKVRANAQGIPVSTYIKSKLFSDKPTKEDKANARRNKTRGK